MLESMPSVSRYSCRPRLAFVILACFCVGLLYVTSHGPSWSTEAFSRALRPATLTYEERVVEDLQESRLTTLGEACRKIGADRRVPKNFERFIVDDDLKIIYCYVPKVGSTNWKRVLLSLKDPRQTPLSIEPDAGHKHEWKTVGGFDDERLTDRNYFKFLVVRNPFERLLSAYRNKFEFAWNNYFRERFGKHMKHYYGERPSNSSENDGIPTFVDFLAYVSSEDSEKNGHWEPVYDICHPCHVKFDFISKYETLQQDSDLILNYITASRGIHRNWSFPMRNETYTRAKPTGDFMQSYYKSVPENIVDKLSELFRNDISLFGYEISPRTALPEQSSSTHPGRPSDVSF